MNTDVGFVRRVDTHNFWNTASYRFWPEGMLINWGPRFRYERLYDYDWILEDEKIDGGFDFTFARNIAAGVGVERSLERFGGIDFWKWRYTSNVNVSTSQVVSVGANYSWGDQVFFSTSPFLGQGTGAGLELTLRPFARLVRNISQFNTFSDRLDVNLLFTYRVNAGTVFFFGYDDHYQQREQFEQRGDELLLSKALQQTNYAIFTKLQFLFRR